jgi:hypothetical protein
MLSYLKYRGGLYRLAGRDLLWGPEEWPSDEYLSTMTEPPPVNKQEYLFLLQQKQEVERKLEQAASPEERRILAGTLRTLFHQITEIRAWLHDKHWAGAQ